MRRLVFVLLVSSLLVTFAFVQKANIPTVKASSILSSSIHQGDLILTGDNVTTIEDRRFDINGSIIVEENATLILKNCILNFAQEENWQFYMSFRNPVNGYPRLVVENATLATNNFFMEIYFYGNTSARVNELSTTFHVFFYFRDSSLGMVSNSTVGYFYPQHFSLLDVSNASFVKVWSTDDPSVAISNCTLNDLEVEQNSEVTVSNSSINGKVILDSWSINYSVTGHKPCFVQHWNFQENCSVIVAPTGKAPNVTLEDTQVEGWGFSSYGNSNATISDSELWGLWARDFSVVSVHNSRITGYALWSFDSSHWHLSNTTTAKIYSHQNSKLWFVNSSSNIYEINDQSEVYLCWYLDVHVIDSEGTDVPSANVTATYPNATLAESRLTDAQGWARVTLMEKMMNTTGEYPVGNYTVTAKYETHTGQESANMTGNHGITISLPFIIPEFPPFLILPLFMVTTLLTVIIFRRKHTR